MRRSEHGAIDILVNNAGITRDRLFRKMSLEDWCGVINTNLNSLFNVTKQVLDGMLEKAGAGSGSDTPTQWSRNTVAPRRFVSPQLGVTLNEALLSDCERLPL
jgi:NAD(P)-dependent dehydrogenase (short-subunit alcohol dehydrogenase family)